MVRSIAGMLLILFDRLDRIAGLAVCWLFSDCLNSSFWCRLWRFKQLRFSEPDVNTNSRFSLFVSGLLFGLLSGLPCRLPCRLLAGLLSFARLFSIFYSPSSPFSTRTRSLLPFIKLAPVRFNLVQFGHFQFTFFQLCSSFQFHFQFNLLVQTSSGFSSSS